MPNNVMIALGSPRKRGNSSALAARLAAGARSGGSQVETFWLHGMNIKPCTACGGCRKKNHVDCVIKDDMQDLYPKLRSADVIVIASPIYWFNFSAQTKLFMDRWYGLGDDQGYALSQERVCHSIKLRRCGPIQLRGGQCAAHLSGCTPIH